MPKIKSNGLFLVGCAEVTTALLMLGHSISVPTLNTLMNLLWTMAYPVILGALVAALCWKFGIRMLGAVDGVFIDFVPITVLVVGVTLATPLAQVRCWARWW